MGELLRMYNEELRNEFLSMIYENVGCHNYDPDDYFDLLNESAKMAGFESYDIQVIFSRDNIEEALPEILGESEITYYIIHLYNFFSKDNPVFQKQMRKYLKKELSID